MVQMNVRLDPRLHAEIKRHAAESGRSVNRWVVELLRAATDPETAPDAGRRIRERLARAGLLAEPEERPAARVDDGGRPAPRGMPLSQIVVDMRREDQ